MNSRSIEMPPGLFDQAINNAHRMKKLGEEHEGSTEDIPAVKMICEWWNNTCLDLRLRRAGSFSIYVKEEGDIEWYNLSNHTLFDNETMLNCSHQCAVPYNCSNIIVEFFACKADFLIVGNDCTTIMVDGTTEKTVKVEDADEAWESYLNLLELEDVLAQDDELEFEKAINAFKKGEKVTFELIIPGL